MNIPFHIPYVSGLEDINIAKTIAQLKTGKDISFVAQCEQKLKALTKSHQVLLTGSCTQALEMALLLLRLKPGDEVICPSFTYVSVVNVILKMGAIPVFVDCREDTMNIDETLLKKAVSSSTKAMIIMHYAGMSCDMETIQSFARSHQITIVEDAAHCMLAYNGMEHLGTFGDMGTISFHSTKNIHSFQGGCLLINNPELYDRALVLRDNGTNKNAFTNGIVDKYTWVDVGGNYGMSELVAAFLHAQLEHVEQVTNERIQLWNHYYQACQEHKINCTQHTIGHNGHIFYIKCKNLLERNQLILHLKAVGVDARFHYQPLHQTAIGTSFKYITLGNHSKEVSEMVLRLPLYFGMTKQEVDYVIQHVSNYYT